MKSDRISFIGDLPKECYIAVSGGADSMAILDFMRKSDRDIKVIHFNHGTKHGAEAEAFVSDYCRSNNLTLEIGRIPEEEISNHNGSSMEAFWREERYEFFSKFVGSKIITAHNLDDQVENHIFTSIRNGNSILIPYSRFLINPDDPLSKDGGLWCEVIRPFIVTKKCVLESWCKRKNVPFIVDPGNSDYKYTRSFIRHEMVDMALRVNPGLHKLVKKFVLNEYRLKMAI